jgi:hypothetical protein
VWRGRAFMLYQGPNGETLCREATPNETRAIREGAINGPRPTAKRPTVWRQPTANWDEKTKRLPFCKDVSRRAMIEWFGSRPNHDSIRYAVMRASKNCYER